MVMMIIMMITVVVDGGNDNDENDNGVMLIMTVQSCFADETKRGTFSLKPSLALDSIREFMDTRFNEQNLNMKYI